MVRDNRKVDSAVLRNLATATRTQREQLDSIYRACRSRVESAPRGWSTGEWDGTLSFMRQELDQLDREQQELVDRAWKTDIASAIAALTETLPLAVWKFLLASNPPVGLAFANPSGALDLVAAVEKLVRGFTGSQGRNPSVTEIGTLVSGGALAGLGLTLTKGSTGNGLAGLEIGATVEAGASARLKPSLPSAGPTKPITSSPVAVIETARFFDKYKGERIPDLGGSYEGECVSLAKRWAKEAYGVELGAFDSGPDGTWKSNAGFDLAAWEKVGAGEGAYRIGDLVFFPAERANGWYGHIGVVTSVPDENGRFSIMEQNYPTGGGVRNDRPNVFVSQTLGVMRHRTR